MTAKSSDSRPAPDAGEIAANFADMHPPLSASAALIEADRCYFCYDAPCTIACPTGIDIPGFIQKIRSDNITGSAHTILSENIMGGMCARVCPTEVLCEQDCVRNTHEEKPVAIGLLQRYATDPVIGANQQLFARGADTGRTVAVVGAGPAGLACAHRLSMRGHQVVLFESREKMGGLNEYGIAAYKTVDDFAQREVDYILGIGGIERRGGTLGKDLTVAKLCAEYDAVFLGVGLNSVNALGLDNEAAQGVIDAVDYIARLRQATSWDSLETADNVVVIGGGMTAIDVAVQSKKLGCENVTIAYRRGPEHMNASPYEQDYARRNGVVIRHWLAPSRLQVDATDESLAVSGIDFVRTRLSADGALQLTDDAVHMPAGIVFKAIGQRSDWDHFGDIASSIQLKHNRICVDDKRRTSNEKIWAGGDCVFGGEDLTVSAVQDGKIAAESIDAFLR
ncbi:MAG: NAD(P)-dependent oxidoreductase [Gammaproteobacteria bacterium]|nr:NAD(P)-dependent oxidoreductase [Gammaproteobacteria bacterium]